jgi:acetolactate synthase-1/2/3 large subunit
VKLSGAQSLIRSLEACDVEVVFGLPGGAILPAYDPLRESSVRHILVRHEQGAGHAAEGYAWATGKVGVCMATSGPGATNLVTALCDAYMDSVPLVAITGQVPSWAIGSDAFQEADTTGITMPVTKHNELVLDVDRIPGAIAEAFHVAAAGRPGPVLVDVPKDILQTTTEWAWPSTTDLPGYRPVTRPNGKRVREAAALLRQARRPVLYVGGGVTKAGAEAALRELAEAAGAPVTTTLMARGAFPDSHPLALGMPGMHGNYAAVAALQEADLLVALGARFDDRVTGSLAAFAPKARIVHADIDPAEIGKNRAADVPIVGDVKLVIEELAAAYRAAVTADGAGDTGAWQRACAQWKQRFPFRYDQRDGGPLKPQHVVERVSDKLDGRGIVVSGVGQHQMWASQLIRYRHPRTWINSGGLGTMGFCVPAAIGAKIGRPDVPVVAVDGDGSFQMTLQELATASTERVPVVFCVINNGVLGMVRQWQELFYDERYSEVHLGFECPDYVKLAEAYGALGLRCDRAEEVDATLEKALATDDQPVVVDFRVDSHEGVFPMVPAGRPNDEIILGPEFTPEEQAAATRREVRA